MDFSDGVKNIIKHDNRFSPQAYYFVSEALSYTQDMLARKGHVSGQELLEGLKRYALQEFGYMARVVLESWGVMHTEDVGHIVFNLVEKGLLGRTEDDHRNDFQNGYDFRKAFDESFALEIPADED